MLENDGSLDFKDTSTSRVKNIANTLTEQLASLKKNNLYRKRTIKEEGRFLNFSSNDYLALGTEKVIKEAYCEGFRKFAVGSGGSAFLGGYYSVHSQLEEAFASALNVDACALFPSGYSVNCSIPRLLESIHTIAVIDKNIHASIYDGISLAKAKALRFRSNNLEDLESKLKRNNGNKVIITEGIFSMNGAISPLNEITFLAKQFNASLIVDEAHSFGILGPQGLGAVAGARLTQMEVPLRVIPLGKAFSASGAIVAGEKIWIDALLQIARANIYSTAVSPAFCYGLLKTLDYLLNADNRREKIFALVDYFRMRIKNSSLLWSNSYTPIQNLQLGCPKLAFSFSEALKKENIFCLPIRPPSVSTKETGLRININYQHDFKALDLLVDTLEKINKERKF
ncbi:8-amino-7-oxononanoate synthase (plasmid) [Legionella adelaidensis]|uniref:8-amino-7-oxononanoate synthase n=1 Tax=Legionella adelaidensis TaxID=45056 RepID=A0A0W0R3K1_9GAMM|nr:pyridoxal phosphate-dependent aminotransferase family protein [Legionella adelaidensis]KTC65665.1 8-amino-7-oxononanoate synthase [Legionella adelaidensis]VEH85139.1 8-amino-7-oxononanoate synthase [Legionella adelaidensis]